MTEQLMAYFNKQPRLGLLSTANNSGKVNAAYFGTAQMIAPDTVVVGLGENRTLDNLKQNPSAVFTIMEPAEAVKNWKGVRVYLTMTDLQPAGSTLESIKQQVAEMAGKETADMLHAAALFQVQEVRPLADFGQGWENSI